MRDVLATFVDRKTELSRFCEMLESDEKPVMVVWGDLGMGKSSLLARLIHECSVRNLRKAEVFVTRDRFNTYLKIMRKVRDDLGAKFFPKFTQLVNFFFPEDPTLPLPAPTINLNLGGTGAQSVLEQAKIENSTIRGSIANVIVEGDIVIKDFMSNDPRRDMNVTPEQQSERMVILTDAFIENLTPLLKDEKLVIFFDDIQELTAETNTWLWGELVRALKTGKMQNARLVLCGQAKPQLEGDAAMFVKEAPLKPLEVPDIVQYLERSRLRAEERASTAETLFAMTDGIPSRVAIGLDSIFEKFPDKKER
jgi:hypothetical protein